MLTNAAAIRSQRLGACSSRLSPTSSGRPSWRAAAAVGMARSMNGSCNRSARARPTLSPLRTIGRRQRHHPSHTPNFSTSGGGAGRLSTFMVLRSGPGLISLLHAGGPPRRVAFTCWNFSTVQAASPAGESSSAYPVGWGRVRLMAASPVSDLLPPPHGDVIRAWPSGASRDSRRRRPSGRGAARKRRCSPAAPTGAMSTPCSRPRSSPRRRPARPMAGRRAARVPR